MKKAPQYLGRAGAEQAKDRLAGYIRYAALIAEQETAIEAEDMDAFDELSREIADLTHEIGHAETQGDDLDDEAHDAAEVLQQALATNRRIQKRLSVLKRESGDEIQNVGRWRTPARRYLADQEEPTTRLDVTS